MVYYFLLKIYFLQVKKIVNTINFFKHSLNIKLFP